MDKSHRNTVYPEDAEILFLRSYPGDQYVLRMLAPHCATEAQPGSFAHIQCDPVLPMRRPFSIMRTSAAKGWVEILFKIVGQGTRLLSRRRPGELVNILGPIGTPFELDPQRRHCLLIGGGVGIPPILFLADRLRLNKYWQPLVFMGSEVPFPFQSRPSKIMVPGIPTQVTASMPLLEDWGIGSRLSSLQGYTGCYLGYVTELARHWIERQGREVRNSIEIFACGPHPMLYSVANLAREYDLACQVSLEEYMACGIGGCAGCVVEVKTQQGPSMKRVCVDGPVFKAAEIF